MAATQWKNRLENGIWTYSMEAVWKGMQECYGDLKTKVREAYGAEIETIGGIGISAMMHGYLAFDGNDELLVPFRTWRNTITEQASRELTECFNYPIPSAGVSLSSVSGGAERRSSCKRY